ncbi:hypothetical protein D3C71_968830 [compost metagenome]
MQAPHHRQQRVDHDVAPAHVRLLMQQHQLLFLRRVALLEARRQHDARSPHMHYRRQTEHRLCLPEAIGAALHAPQSPHETVLLADQSRRHQQRTAGPDADQQQRPRRQRLQWPGDDRPDAWRGIDGVHCSGDDARRRQQHRAGSHRHRQPQQIRRAGAQPMTYRPTQQHHHRHRCTGGQHGHQQRVEKLSAAHHPAPPAVCAARPRRRA